MTVSHDPDIHAPGTGLTPLFRIGARPVAPQDRFVVDRDLGPYLAEKVRLAEERFDQVFAAVPGTEAAQSEVLALLVKHLPERFPNTYLYREGTMHIVPVNRQVAVDQDTQPALWRAALLVPEDLVIMSRRDDGWRLAAAALCFPSSWRLADKIGRPLHEVHAPVPGFGAGTRNDTIITRMFDHLRPEMPIIRWNWSLYADDQLFHPTSGGPDRPRFGSKARPENVFLRVERQTLSILPDTGDILFTIRIFIDPLEQLMRSEKAGRIAVDLAAGLMDLDADQLAYKGLTADRDRLLARLEEIARANPLIG